MNRLLRKSSFAVALVLATSGCSTWSNKTTSSQSKMWPPTEWFKKSYQKPTSMAAIWSPDVLAMPGKPSTRGFGGRVYFYNELSQAIPVDGEIVVHGYLTKGKTPSSVEQVVADKTFAFTQEQLKNHFSPSELGASYSIWIPWDAAHGYRQEVTLIPTFKSIDGSLVQGEAAKVFLPGRKVEEDRAHPPAVQTVSYRSSTMPTNAGYELPRFSKGLRTTTIDVPASSSLARSKPMSKELQSYLLNSSKQPTEKSGMATATNAPAASKAVDASITPTSLKPPPAEQGSDAGEATETPLLSPHDLKPMRSPISHQPWHLQKQHHKTVPLSDENSTP